MIGNESTVSSIKLKIEEGKLPHFILLSGPSGCGKTTIARIIKDELNCSDSDFYEINGANRNGVELARDIESKFRFGSLNGKVRIWLIDECHKLTPACQESLLKPLEDTPDHVYFIFATTDPRKIVKTIKTRATEYKVNSLNDSQLEKLIKRVSRKEKIDLDDNILYNIIDNSEGSARMCLVLLDKIRGLDKTKQKEIIEQTKQNEEEAYSLLKVLMNWDRGGWKRCIEILNDLNQEPESIRRYILSAASNQLLKPNKGSSYENAYKILCSFEKDFYTTGRPGLIVACFEVMNGE
jgi:DNA polymerase-3 subunit gamma/tau